MKRILRNTLIFICIVVLATAGMIAWRVRPRTIEFYTDADSIKETPETAVVREILWTPPKELSEKLNTTADDYEPRLSADGQTLFFVRGKAGENADIYCCTRTPEGWSDPTPLSIINTTSDELGPEVSPDGDALYFYSDRPGSLGGYDLWVSHKGDNGWRPAINLGPHANSPYNDYGPAISPEGRTLYFASNRPTAEEDLSDQQPSAWSATIREDQTHRDYDLYASELSDGGVGQAAPLDELNTEYNEGSPAVSTYGDFLYFASNRPGGLGGFDLYRARRVQGTLRSPDNLGPAVNTAANELDPDLSLGGYSLHFSSDRECPASSCTSADDRLAATHADGEPPDYNLYFTTSREVFRDAETQQADIDWAGLWGEIGPNLLWALLALLLTVLLLILLRDFRERRLSLLARCLLASVLIHTVLMFLLNVVEVSSGLMNAIRGRGKIRVALVSNAAACELTSQIRGELTQVNVPLPEVADSAQQEFDTLIEPPSPMASLAVEPTSVALREPTITIDYSVDAPVPSEDADDWQPSPATPTQETPASRFDLATPDEVNPVQRAERDAPIAPPIVTSPVERAATMPAATTQPVIPAAQYAVEPARGGTLPPEALPSTADADAKLQDAAPGRMESTLAWTHEQRAAGIPLPQTEMALPDETAPRTTAPASHEEPTPRVAMASVTAPRAATELPLHDNAPATTEQSHLRPERTAHAPPEAVSPEQTLASPRDAAVVDSATRPLMSDVQPTALTGVVSLDDLQLPVEAAAPARTQGRQQAEPMLAKSLAPEATDHIREKSPLAVRLMNDAAPSSETIHLAPKAVQPQTSIVAESEAQPFSPSDANVRKPSTVRFARRPDSTALVGVVQLDELQWSAETPSAAHTPADRNANEATTRRPAPESVDHIREKLPPAARLMADAGSSSKTIHLAPEAARPATDVATASATMPFAPNDAATTPSVPPAPDAVAATTPAIGTGMPTLDLNVPTDTEPPGLRKIPGHAVGVIFGRVADTETLEPLAGATIRLALPNDQTVVVKTDEAGLYELAVPPVPDFFALSASSEGYVPATSNISAAMLTGRQVSVDFALARETEYVIALEEEPDVHHLGNDRFTGRINSQFQKESEGEAYKATFELRADQLQSDYTHAEVWLMVKGVQCEHVIRINGRRLRQRLDESPDDGSFGPFTAPFKPIALKAGTNTIEIQAKSCQGDLDDFEFVNVQIRLRR